MGIAIYGPCFVWPIVAFYKPINQRFSEFFALPGLAIRVLDMRGTALLASIQMVQSNSGCILS